MILPWKELAPKEALTKIELDFARYEAKEWNRVHPTRQEMDAKGPRSTAIIQYRKRPYASSSSHPHQKTKSRRHPEIESQDKEHSSLRWKNTRRNSAMRNGWSCERNWRRLFLLHQHFDILREDSRNASASRQQKSYLRRNKAANAEKEENLNEMETTMLSTPSCVSLYGRKIRKMFRIPNRSDYWKQRRNAEAR